MIDKFTQEYENASSQSYGKFAKKVEIVKGVPSILRFLDLPNGFMGYFESWILCDDEVKRPFIIKNEIEKSILYDIIGDRDKFYEGGFLASVKNPKTNKPNYIWQMKDPALFNRVMYNDNLSNADGSWKSRQQYAFNCILRNAIIEEGKSVNWCIENQHAMLINLIPSAFKALGDLKILYGNPSEYDIVYSKTGTGFDTIHSMSKGDPVEYREVYIGELTDEEKTYGRWNLKKEAAVTPASKILERLGETIERISSVMGIDWIGKLEAASAAEAEEEGVNSNAVPPVQQPMQAPPVVESAPILQPSPQPVPQQQPVQAEVQQPIVPESQPVQAEVQQPMAQPVQQPLPASVTPPGQVQPAEAQQVRRPTRVPVTQQLQSAPQEMENCFYCGAQTPVGSLNCGQCGNVLMEPCANASCNKLFHVSLNTCPHCGMEYAQDLPNL